MSNYIKTTNFAAKDSLPSGNPSKIVKGTEINTEFDNIAVASATKLNSSAVSTFGGTLIDDANASAARTTLGLGTAATTASTDYATAAQGTTADAALPRTGGAMTGAITTNSTFDGRDVATDGTKLDGIEAGATADQTAAEIKTAYESNANTNAFTDTDETKLDGIEAGADVTDTTNVVASLSAGTGISLSAGGEIANTAPDQTVALTGAGGTSISGTYPSFTITSTSFALPVATDTTLGGIELFSDTDQTVVANAVTTTAARTYGIQLNSDNQAVVNVPWINTTYTVGDGGLTEINFTSADNTKLDGIEASADVTDTANVTAAGALMTTGGTLTGDLNFGDNEKATFGAGDDLQIYHDGYSSYISHNTTGEDLVIEATSPGDDVIIRAADDLNFRVNGNENCIVAVGGGATTLYNSNSAKLATTATGIDVTGTVTMDGLTVSLPSNAGNTLFYGGAQSDRGLEVEVSNADGFDNSAWKINAIAPNAGSTLTLATRDTDRVKLASNGDISFYEDTGTTPKLFWDASAESLTIDGSEEASSLATAVTSSILELNGNSGGSAAAWFGSVSGGNQYVQAANGAGTTGYSFLINPYGGSVGIGTSSPDTLLEVVGADPILTIRDTETSGASSNATLRLAESGASDTLNNYWDINHTGGSALRFVSKIGATTAERMRIDSLGNVGIGTSSPSAPLAIVATANQIPALGAASSHAAIGSGGFGTMIGTKSTGVGYIQQQRFDGTATAYSLALQPNGGNVGIGTSSPARNLVVKGSIPHVSILANTNTQDCFLDFGDEDDDNKGRIVYANSDDSLAFYSNASEKMRIDSSGNVGIGTDSPSAPVTIKSSSTSGSTSGLLLQGNSNTNTIVAIGEKSTDGGRFHMYDGGVEKIAFYTDGTANHISSGNVGIGTSSPSRELEVTGTGNVYIKVTAPSATDSTALELANTASTWTIKNNDTASDSLTFDNGTERMRIDSSGNLLVGGTNTEPAVTNVTGIAINAGGRLEASRSGGIVANLNRKSDDGDIAVFRKDGTAVGSIGVNSSTILQVSSASSGGLFFGDNGDNKFGFVNGENALRPASDNEINLGKSDRRFKDLHLSGTAYVATDGVLSETAEAGSTFYFSNNNIGLKAYSYISSNRLIPCDENGANRDNYVDLGQSNARFDDIYATNGTIQTSDRNEKQDIAELSDAEQRVAVACKGLLRKFRWKSAVEEKGDEARIHFGIIAQDLQAAFAAEGLDAGDYGMFISTTWTDEETNEEKTRLGVRYSELLAFIISAL